MWTDILPIMVRHLIGDLDETPIYSDDRIEQGLIVSGFLVSQEYSFSTEYTFDIEDNSITPDPTATDTYDAVAIALLTLKTACILNSDAYQNSLRGGIKIREGDAHVDTTSAFAGYKDILDNGPCKSYEKMLNKLHMGQSIGRAVMSPFVHPNVNIGLTVRPFFDSFSRM